MPRDIWTFVKICQMRRTVTVTGSQTLYQDFAIWQGQNPPVETTFQTLLSTLKDPSSLCGHAAVCSHIGLYQTRCSRIRDDTDDIPILKQIVYMPMEALLAPEVSGDPGFQAAESTAGVYIVTSREMKATQLANSHGRILG